MARWRGDLVLSRENGQVKVRVVIVEGQEGGGTLLRKEEGAGRLGKKWSHTEEEFEFSI